MKRAILNLNGSSKRTNITIVLWIIILLCLNGFQKVYSQTYGPPVFFDDFGVVPAGQNVNSFRGDITGRGTIGNSYWYWPETCTGTGGWLSQSVPSTEVSYDIVLPEAEDGVTNWVFVAASTSTNGTDPYTSAENINNPNNLWCWSYNTWTKNPINCTGTYSRWYFVDGNWRHGHWERLWYKKWATCSNWHNGMDDGGYALTANPDYTHGNDHAWLAGPDHTPGDENGMMLVVNAAFVKGLFYKRVIPGLCYGSQFEFKAYYANILSSLAGCKPGIPINIRFEVWDKDPGDDEINSTILVGGKASNGATLIAFNNTGDIPGGSSSLIWHENKLIFDVPQNQDNIVLILRNNGVGGCGNDLAIDDISFRPYMPFSIGYETNIDNYCLSGVVSQKGILTSGTVPAGGTYYYQWQEATEGTTNWINLGKPASSLLDVKVAHNIRELGDKIYRVISSPSLQNLNNSNCYVASPTFAGNSIMLPTATISGEADVCGTEQHTPVNASFTINYHGNEFPWTYYYRVNDGPELSQIVNGPAITDTKSISVTDNSKVELLRIVTDECSLGLQLNSIHNITYSVGKPSVPNTILGPNPACIGDVAEFSIQEVPGVISYNWVVSGGWEVISGQGTPHVKLKIGNAPIYVLITTENACGTSVWTSEVFQAANLSPDTPENIYAPKGICMPSTETGFTDILFECSMVNGASNYIWDWDPTVSMGTQENGTGQYLRKIVLSVPNRLSTFNVRVRSQNACGYSAIKEVTINTTRIPKALAGNDRIICSGSETNIGSAPVAGNTYNWTSIPPGFISSTANPVVSPLTTTTYVLVETNVSSGCSNTNSIKVAIEDLTRPTITAPDDVFATTNKGCTSTNVNLGLPTITDNCSVLNLSNNAPTDFPLGRTIVTWTVTDGAGLTATATQRVTIEDNIQPISPTLADVTVGECSGTPITPMTTDNCSGPIHGTTTTVFPITTQGITIVTWTFDDGHGNVTTANQNVIVKDITAPVPDLASLPAITGECSATVTAPTATDNCKNKITATTTDPLTYSEQGIYTIHWTYDDGNGNTSTQTQSVVVNDSTPPETPVLADVTVGECSGTPVAPTTTDLCKGTITGSTTTEFPITIQGTTVVTWTFDDGHGNSTTANQNVIVKDITAPVPDVAILPAITGACTVTVTAPTATDNCKDKITATTTDPLTYSEQGIYTIHWTYHDGNGNKTTANQNVIVKDVTAPVADINDLPAITGECSATVTAPTATDNCKGKITATTTDPLTYSEQGIYTIHWTYDDGNDNISSQEQTVIVRDITPPETPLLADVTVGECSGTPVAPTTTDLCKGTITGSTTTEFPLTNQGTTVVTWTFDDLHGNVTTASQNVIVKDVTAPVADITNLPAITGECSAVVTAPTATDNCKDKITATTTDPLTYSEQGIYTIHWRYDDGNGNTFTQMQSVVVNDSTPPETPVLADVTVGECSGTPVAPTTTDLCKGTITGSTTTEFPLTTQGTTVVTWTFDDGHGNVTTANQKVIVANSTAPVPDIAVLPNATGECSVTVNAPLATKNCEGKIVGTTTDPLTYSEQGNYTIHWTYDDDQGNIFTQTQSVVVDDITAPVPDIAELPAIIGECRATATSPTATDNCKDKIVGTTTDPLIYSEQGNYTIHWNYNDGQGNISIQTQSVVVDDINPPKTPVLADVTVGECSGTPVAPTTTDLCKGTITGSTTTEFPITTQGTTVVTWTFDDGHGNVTTANQNVIVKDITAPVPDVADLPAITGECSATVTAPTATDNCKGKITAMTTDPLTYSEQGIYTIHWTYDDGNGNTFTQMQSVVVDDTTPTETPVLADVTVGECSGTPIFPTTTDLCKGTIIGSTTTEFPITTQGTTVVTWTFDDGNGNVTTANQNVIVKDVTAPVSDLAMLPTLTVQYSITVTAPTATDNCKGKITATTTDPLTYSEQGIYTIHWTYDDGNGNTFTQAQSVEVDDTTPPETPVLTDVIVGECSGKPVAPTTTDNTYGEITGTTTTVFPITTQGTTIVSWTFDDGKGNVTTANQNVIVKDITAPVPDIAELPAITGECSATATAPTATDNCKGKITATTTDPLTYSEQGIYTIHWTYDDGNGNTFTQTQSVVVDDTTPPEAPVLADVYLGECSGTPPTPTAMDNCSGIVKGTTSILFPKTKQGKNTIIWTFDDGHGNVTTAYQNLILEDKTAPVPDIASLPAITEECSVTVNPPTATDNCKGKITATTTDPLTYSEQGSFTIHWRYDDGNGNISTQTQSVVVDDTTPPETPVLADIFLGECSGTPPTPTTMDNCAGIVKGTTSILFPKTKQGRHTIIWTFDDGHGNVATAYQNLILEDKTAPVPDLASLPAITAECSATVTAPTATDNCKGKITAATTDPLTYSEQGIYTIHWRYDDGNGNTSTQTQSIVIDDTTPPEAPVLADVYLGECSGTPPTPTAMDNCSGIVKGTTSILFPKTKQGRHTIIWSFDDGHGNVATAYQNLILEDKTAPVPDVETLADVRGQCSVTVTAPTATDNCKGKITAITTDPLVYSEQGTYTIHWTYEDGNGNVTTAKQNVIVEDHTPPQITGTIAPTTVEGCSVEEVIPAVNTVAALEAMGLSISDVCMEDQLLTVTSKDVVSEESPITVIRTYTIKDGSFNSTDYKQTIMVVDTQKPTIVCPADLNIAADDGNCNATGLVLSLPVTEDNCSVSSVTNDAPAVFGLGKTVVTWTVVDKSGNKATCHQNVTVDGIPVAMDDNIAVDENSQIAGNVTTNDKGLCDTPIRMNIMTEPEFGSLTFSNDGSFKYIPDNKYSGKDKFTYQICDSDGDCSSATVEITINSVNDLPQANADTEDLQVDVIWHGNVAVNDVLSGDGNNVWTLDTHPSNGTILFNEDGTYTYTPYASFIGNDSFSYELCDANGDCSKAKVTIHVDDVLLPNQILTPNSDDHNDTFIINGIEYYPINKVTVYNRWGNVVYSKNNYQNEWDGVSKVSSKPLPVGTYYYLIDYGNNRHKTGFVYLDR
jgi:gliding motility-associated-like protein